MTEPNTSTSYHHAGDAPVYAPDSKDRAYADETGVDTRGWEVDGEMVREVMDDAARERLVSNITGHASQGVSGPMLERVFDYWRGVDKTVGDAVAANFAR